MSLPCFHRLLRAGFGVLGLQVILSGAVEPSAWRQQQTVTVPAAGLMRLALSPDTLGASRPDLADLRLLDPAGGEVPYAVDRRVPPPPLVAVPRQFQVSLGEGVTRILIETGITQAVEAVALETTTAAFVKGVRVEGSGDGRAWTLLGEGLLVFRQAGNVQQTLVLAPAVWAWLRVSVDDRRSPPVVFTGATLRGAIPELPTDTLPAMPGERTEQRGVSRIAVRLPAANLWVSALEFDCPEPLFTREVALLVPVADSGPAGGKLRERRVAGGSLYRLEVEGQTTQSRLTLEVESRIETRDVWVQVVNGDSPPLDFTGVRVRVRPVELVFRAGGAGRHRLLTGNPDSPAPRYDLAGLGSRFLSLPATRLAPAALEANPGFSATLPLPGVPDQAATLEVAAWSLRKPVRVSQGGIQQLELDLETLAAAQSDLSDLRLLRGAVQVPYLHDPDRGVHRVTPVVTPADDPQQPGVSRWQLRLPHPRLPVLEVSAASGTPLFQRRMMVYETVTDERNGARHRRLLGQAAWSRTPGALRERFVLTLEGSPQTDTIELETENSDNPPIGIEAVAVMVSAPRLWFKLAEPAEDLFLYYGNPDAGAPRYDLGLVAAEVKAAPKVGAGLGPAEPLKPGTGWRTGAAGMGRPAFWVVLAVVTGTLLVLILRLLPKPPGDGDQAR